MRNKLVRGSVVAAGLGLAATALAVSPAQAATVTQVRAADLVISLNDVRSAGHYDFLAEGVHVKTDNATSQAKVALYFPVTGALPTTGNVEWYGTSPAPARSSCSTPTTSPATATTTTSSSASRSTATTGC